MAAERTGVSVIVPTYREAANLVELTQRVFEALDAAGLCGELIFVDDDSRDGSEAIVSDLATTRPVRMHVRRGERGLSSAVIAGFGLARYDVLAVLDADLQHPPERLPDVVAPILADTADFVIGSRYVTGGVVAERWPWFRRLNSLMATWLARPLTHVRDPMSGFFGLHRRTWQQARDLNPIGYKIALELLVKSRCRCVIEIPISFNPRSAGESKLTFREQLRYLRHLVRLYWFRYSWYILVGFVVAAGVVATLVGFRVQGSEFRVQGLGFTV